MLRWESGWETHGVGGWQVRWLRVQDGERSTMVRFVPAMGCNVIGWEVDGVEYLVASEPDGRILGTPILYPMPNRVRDGVFSFDGREFRFAPNNGPNFIHGLVRDVLWELDEPQATQDGVSLTARVAIEPGTPLYEIFPIGNTLTLRLQVALGRLEMAFTVQNDDAVHRLPFGLAIHPYFAIHGRRSDVTLHVPARRCMEAESLLPTGRLLPASACSADPTQPVSLEGLDLDDVFWGMRSDHPATITYTSLSKRVTLAADDWFTHAVVYTPPEAPYFCVENQSCSTDAHNLHTRGLTEAAHLTILEPGQTHRASIVFRLDDV